MGHQIVLPNVTAHGDPNVHPSIPGISTDQGEASQMPLLQLLVILTWDLGRLVLALVLASIQLFSLG